MTRREVREHVFRQLFTAQFYRENEEEISEQMALYFTHPAEDELDFPSCELEAEEQEEVLQKTRAVLEHLDGIDSLIGKTSRGWTVERMNRADLAILRLGVYELLYDGEIPSGVAINEAVLLARKFGGEDSYSFVNGILGKIQREKSPGGGEN